MKKSIIFILLSTMVINSRAIPPEQEQAGMTLLAFLAGANQINKTMQMAVNAGSLGTVTGISAGVITGTLLSKAPGVSDSLISKLCIVGISGVVAWKVREIAIPKILDYQAERELNREKTH